MSLLQLAADLNTLQGKAAGVCAWAQIPRKDVAGTLQERRWFYIRNGAPKDYHGPAVHWRHLSRWERNVLGIHKQYDAVKDAQQRREARAAHLTQAQEAIAAKKGLTTLSAKQKLADGQV